MQKFEMLFIAATYVLLMSVNFGNSLPYFTPVVLGVAMITLSLHFLTEIYRWQLLPTFSVFIGLVFIYSMDSNFGLTLQIVGIVLGSLLVLLSTVLVVGLPLKALPQPSGPYLVGSSIFRAQASDGANKRELEIEIWYPASGTTDVSTHPCKTLWQQLYDNNSEHIWPVRFLSRFLRGISTHSYIDAMPNSEGAPYPVVLYQHGLVSFTSENTLLMEHLASNGYLVVACSYTKHYQEFIEVMKNLPAEVRKNDAVLNARMKQAKSRSEFSDLMLEFVKASPGTNTLVKRRVQDTQFVLDNLHTILIDNEHIQQFAQLIDLNKLGIMGLSLGGAVATEFSKSNDRCLATINFDGAHFGERQDQGLNKPYLMFNKELTAGCNDFMMEKASSDYVDVVVKNCKHIDFHDQSLLFPLLQWLGMSGSINAQHMNAMRNRASKDFFDQYLKNKTIKPLQELFPELVVKSNLH